MQHTTIHISTKTLVSVLAFVLGVFLLLQLWNIVLLLFAALILAALIDPFARWFAEKKIPRGLAVVLVYILLFGALGGTVYLLAPVVSEDIPQLLTRFETVVSDIEDTGAYASIRETLSHMGISLEDVSSAAASTESNGGALSSAIGAVGSVFQGVASFILILVIAFYMITEEDPLKKIVHSVVPSRHVDYVVGLLSRIRDKLAFWIRGQLILSIVIGVVTYIGLSLLGVRYAAALALIAALLEFIPYLGPILAAIPAFVVAFTQGGVVFFLVVLAFYTVVQQLENHILAPKIMQKAVGLNPIISIVALLIGAQLAGILGAIIAIPLATALGVILKDVTDSKTTID